MKARSKSGDRFPTQVPRASKRKAGRTEVGMTPLNVRAAGVTLEPQTREHVQRRMARQLDKFALQIERSTVRFQDVNGPRGGKDKLCSIKVVLAALPSVVVEERAATPREAFDRAAGAVERAVRRTLARAEISTKGSRRKGAKPARGGNGVVDTAQAGVSASKRKVGAGSTARRNLKKNLAGLTSALEDSAQDTPSRKSTRGSANRAKRDSNLKRRQTRKVTSPKERARRNLAGKRGGAGS